MDDRAGLGEAAVDEFGSVLDPFEREATVLTTDLERVMSCTGRS